MNRAYQLLSLYLLIPSALHSAELENKKLNVNEQVYYRFIKAYSNMIHAEQREYCYGIRVSPDEEYVVSMGLGHGYDNNCYVRLHSTQNGKNQLLSENYIFTSAKIIYDAAWSPDSAYVVIEDHSQSSAFPIQSPQPQAHVAASYQDKEKCYYTLASSCPTSPVQRTVVFTPNHTHGISSHASLCHPYYNDFYLPEQSCFLNNGTLIAIYAPEIQNIVIITNTFKKPAQYIHSMPNVTAANLSGELPIIGRLNGEVNLLNPDTGLILTTLPAFSGKAVTAVALARKRIAALSERHINILSQENGRKIAQYTHTGPHKPQLLRLNPSGTIVVYNAHRSLFIFASATAQSLQKIRLDEVPHSLFFGKKGLIVGTSQSIKKFVCTKPKDKKQKEDT